MRYSDKTYDFLLGYVNRCFRLSYSSLEYAGIGNIPADGAIIFAPNHANTLMDALAVLSLDNRAKVFVARADIFKNKMAAPILDFLKMLPINRIRDGKDALSENGEVFRQCIDALCAGLPFCILPEGTHRTMHSLLPLRKGIARIALEAIRDIPGDMPVRIVPVGLEYEDYFMFRSRLLVTVAEPIDVRAFAASVSQEPDAVFCRQLLKEIESRIKASIVCLPDDERYNGLWEASNIFYSRQNRHDAPMIERRAGLQKAVDMICKRHPELIGKAEESAALRRKLKIRLSSITSFPTRGGVAIRCLGLLLILPAAVAEALLLSPALATISIFRKLLKDKAFSNAIRFVTCFILYRPLLLLGCLTAAFFHPIASACILAAGWIAPIVFYDYVHEIGQLISDIKYLKYKDSIPQNF